MNPLDPPQTPLLHRSSRRRFSLVQRLAPALVLSLVPLLGAGQPAVVHAASGDCTPSGSQITCTFTYTGTEQTWQVPPGVTSATITAVGGSGSSYVDSSGTTVAAGGKGARATATVPLTGYETLDAEDKSVPVTTLYVEVGAPTPQSYGFNGGGGPNQAGGDASDVRICSVTLCKFFSPSASTALCSVVPTCVDDRPSAPWPGVRLVVAGGGGGAGRCAVAAGGQAGDATVTGAGAGGGGCAPGANGGFGGTAGGGAGNIHITPAPDVNGLGGGGSTVNGSDSDVCSVAYSGIAGVPTLLYQTYLIDPACLKAMIAEPGSGGGGYFGGGWGGVTSTDRTGGGGGAGSSFWYAGATNTALATDTTGQTLVSITYTPDTTPPTANPSLSPQANAAGWNTTDVTVTWNWTDAAAGVDTANCTTSSTSSSEGAQLSLTATCTDKAGNVGSASRSVNVDKTPPTVSAAVPSPPNPSGWYTVPVTVHFTCADTLSGVATCPADQTLGTDGSAVSSTAQTATDVAGNTSAPSNAVTVKLDQTAPTVTCAAPDGAWHASDVSMGCTSSDATSGLANAAADASFQLTTSVAAGTETANATTGSHKVSDVAGNTTTAGPLAGNKVDKKAPSISLSQPTATSYLLNQAVAASYGCTDAGSGLATCAGPVASGATIDTSSAGPKTFTVTATDNVGNTSSQSVTYTVVADTTPPAISPASAARSAATAGTPAM